MGGTDVNPEQAKSLARWFSSVVGPFLISHGYVSAGGLEIGIGVFVSLAPLVWAMFVHTQTNAVAVVDAIAKQPDSPVKAVVTEPTTAGRELAASMPGNTTVVAGSQSAETVAKR
jgi:hypothetical protein